MITKNYTSKATRLIERLGRHYYDHEQSHGYTVYTEEESEAAEALSRVTDQKSFNSAMKLYEKCRQREHDLARREMLNPWKFLPSLDI